MYEPLWTLSKTDAHEIYKRILYNIKEQKTKFKKKVYVVYYYVGLYNGDATRSLLEMDAKLLYQSKYSSLFFGAEDENSKMFIYIF
jgi:hypothetical protein